MHKKLRILKTIDQSGAVLIVRLESAELAEQVAEAAIAGGFQALEITLSIPGAVDVIRQLSAKHGPNGVAIGAGTGPGRAFSLRVHPSRR
jgi:2-dehydro-3-deoxyphosphogluconate aldolase/(4S)-4-hydroxy-2-oxoglutarate aldolase